VDNCASVIHLPPTTATGPGFQYTKTNYTGPPNYKLPCASNQVYCKIFDNDQWLQCTDPIGNVWITFSATFYTKDGNEKIGFDLNVTRSGYTLGAVYMKGGPGGIQYYPPPGAPATVWGKGFYTGTCNGINKGISHVDVCLNRQNFTGGNAPPAPPARDECNVLVEEFNFETPGQNTKWSNSKNETQANFTTFLGRLTQGASTSYTFKNITRDRKKLVLEFDLYEIDDWEAGQAGVQYADILYITLNAGSPNSMEIPLGSYNKEFDEGYFEDWFADVKYTSRSLGPPANLGFGTDPDQKHKVIMEIPNRFIRSDNSLVVGFKFSSTAADEFAGFDNIKLLATCDEPDLAPTAAPTKVEQKRIIPNSCTPGSWGDPHIRPWNCQQYDFFGKCDVMVRKRVPQLNCNVYLSHTSHFAVRHCSHRT
jgi:hypothetical protein